jgi:hypothetical protein
MWYLNPNPNMQNDWKNFLKPRPRTSNSRNKGTSSARNSSPFKGNNSRFSSRKDGLPWRILREKKACLCLFQCLSFLGFVWQEHRHGGLFRVTSVYAQNNWKAGHSQFPLPLTRPRKAQQYQKRLELNVVYRVLVRPDDNFLDKTYRKEKHTNF